MVRFSIVVEGDARGFDEYSALAQIAEQAGFYSFQVYEHVGFRPSWAILFSIARNTKRILLGPVTVPVFLHHPVYLASNLATLAEVTQGRALLGVSKGAFYERMGSEPPNGGESREAIRECVQIVYSLITEESKEGYDGRFFRVPAGTRLQWNRVEKKNEAHAGEQSLEGESPWSPTTTIYVGTSGRKMVSSAVSLGCISGIVTDNLWNPAYFKQMRAWIEEDCVLNHRDPGKFELIPRPFCSIAESRAEALTQAEKSLRRYLPHLMGRSKMIPFAGLKYDDVVNFANGDLSASNSKKLVDNFCACGTPQEISGQVEEMIGAGAEHICFGHPLGKNPVAALRLLTSGVTSRFQQ